jgi:hypothetical protein
MAISGVSDHILRGLKSNALKKSPLKKFHNFRPNKTIFRIKKNTATSTIKVAMMCEIMRRRNLNSEMEISSA